MATCACANVKINKNIRTNIPRIGKKPYLSGAKRQIYILIIHQ